MKPLPKILKVLLSATATVTLSGCPAMASQPLPYLCELAMSNARLNTKNIIDSDNRTPKRSLEVYYTTYKNSLVSLTYECPEDSIEVQGVLDTEPLVDALYDLKGRM